jgi:catechol 2,3-dioxygenase
MAALPPETRVGRVKLRVADRERAAAFYRAVTGLAPVETEDAGAGTTTLGVDGDAVLLLEGAPDVPARPADTAGRLHLAYRYPDRSSLAAALGRTRAETRLTGASDHLVSEALYLRDPEDVGVELYRDRPREEWSHTDGGVEMDTLPLDLDDLAAAGPVEPPADAPAGTDVGHVHLEVTDLDRAAAFYGDALGFAEMARYDGGRFVAAGGYHHHVGFNVWNGRSAPASGRGLDWFELVLPDGDAVDAAADRLAAAGHDPRPVEGRATVAVTDPDGIELRLRPE